jgi:hypothetical protein
VVYELNFNNFLYELETPKGQTESDYCRAKCHIKIMYEFDYRFDMRLDDAKLS